MREAPSAYHMALVFSYLIIKGKKAINRHSQPFWWCVNRWSSGLWICSCQLTKTKIVCKHVQSKNLWIVDYYIVVRSRQINNISATFDGYNYILMSRDWLNLGVSCALACRIKRREQLAKMKWKNSKCFYVRLWNETTSTKRPMTLRFALLLCIVITSMNLFFSQHCHSRSFNGKAIRSRRSPSALLLPASQPTGEWPEEQN